MCDTSINSKKQALIKRSKICRSELMGDRLSTLPDEVLHLILSYLNTKLAVQTCVLSKRWRYLWTGISSLHFESTSFSDDDSFEKFLNHVFLHRDHSKTIRQFKIYYFADDSITKLVIDFLVTHAHSIQDLVLSYDVVDEDGEKEYLPQPYWNLLYTWNSLKTLSLEHICINKNVDYEFVSLITLHLNNFVLWDSIKITAPELKEFKMSFMHRPVGEVKMILSFPKLLSFCFEGDAMVPVSFSPYPILQKLHVDLCLWDPWEDDFKDLINMFGAIGRAKFVTLSEETIGALSVALNNVEEIKSPCCGVEELKIVVPRWSNQMRSNLSFTVPYNVLTYLLTMSPAKGITVVHQT